MRGLDLADVQAADLIFQLAIGDGHASMQPQVLRPRVRHERLHVAPFFGRVLVYGDVVAAVAADDANIGTHRLEKRLAVLGIDAIFDQRENRTLVRLDVCSRDGLGPVHGGREVDGCAGL